MANLASRMQNGRDGIESITAYAVDAICLLLIVIPGLTVETLEVKNVSSTHC